VTLTPRERAVLLCAIRGLSARETGLELHIAESTVRQHRSAILARARVHSMTVVAYRYGRGELA